MKSKDESDKKENSLDKSEQVGLPVHKASSFHLLTFNFKDKILIPNVTDTNMDISISEMATSHGCRLCILLFL